MAYIDELKPLYSIVRYSDTMYKVIRFKRSDGFGCRLIEKDDTSDSTEKFDSSVSRARKMVFEYAMCNPWEWFFTGTLDSKKCDRLNLDKFHSDFTEFIKYRSKKYGSSIKFLLVPERHKDGAWHIHGLLHGLPHRAVERFTKHFFVKHGVRGNYKLIRNDFYNWEDYFNKFGFCSLSPVRSPVGCSYYITKYISEDISDRKGEIGSHLYYVSRGLNKAEKITDVYCSAPALDSLLQCHYEFCSTGIAVKDWTFPLEYDETIFSSLRPYTIETENKKECAVIDTFVNMKIEGF